MPYPSLVDPIPQLIQRLSHQPPPVFRGEIPVMTAPDRAANPGAVELSALGPRMAAMMAAHLAHAHRIMGRDLTGLTTAEVIDAQADMEMLCASILPFTDFDPGTHTVFFDPSTDSFWIYPNRRPTTL